jgi:hypothetical protein
VLHVLVLRQQHRLRLIGRQITMSPPNRRDVVHVQADCQNHAVRNAGAPLTRGPGPFPTRIRARRQWLSQSPPGSTSTLLRPSIGSRKVSGRPIGLWMPLLQGCRTLSGDSLSERDLRALSSRAPITGYNATLQQLQRDQRDRWQPPSRHHIRLHTGGPSTSRPGYNVIAGTPHYDKICATLTPTGNRVPKHEICTFAGARRQFAKNVCVPTTPRSLRSVHGRHRRLRTCPFGPEPSLLGNDLPAPAKQIISAKITTVPCAE